MCVLAYVLQLILGSSNSRCLKQDCTELVAVKPLAEDRRFFMSI